MENHVNQKKLYWPLWLIVGLLAAHLGIYFFGVNHSLKQALKLLEKADSRLQEASKQLDAANEQAIRLHQEMEAYRSYIRDIQGRVEVLDLEKKLRDDRYKVQRDSIRMRLDYLTSKMDLTGRDLPEIKEDTL